MDLNKETAMRLWNKSFGNVSTATDYTGRTIVKGAYNDRNSKNGWNVDHILPQSKGGKTADYNLICCHIKTNDEKADRFPAFKANGIAFEIVKVERHYEIRRVTGKGKEQKSANTDKNINFMDSAAGIRLFNKLSKKEDKPCFVGTVFIQMQDVKDTAIVGFIEKMFDSETMSCSSTYTLAVTLKNYNMNQQESISELLDKCILLNTYMKHYFLPLRYLTGYKISYSVEYFSEKWEAYKKQELVPAQYILVDSITSNALFINELVYINSEAEERCPELSFSFGTYQEYDFIFTNLAKKLIKEVGE